MVSLLVGMPQITAVEKSCMMVPVDDKCIARSYAVKEVLVLSEGKVLAARRKLDRLYKEAELLSLSPKMRQEEVI